MGTKIFEEDSKKSGAPMGDQAKGIEKQARQLAYDIRYEIKKASGGKQMDAAALKRAYLQGLQKSSQAPAIKLRAKQMLLGEDYISDISNIVSDSVAKAMYSVFVEGTSVEDNSGLTEYLEERSNEASGQKYKVRVTDKKTGNSYVRYATREKISELRANPNISSVEMTEHGDPREGERSRGEDTARVKRAKKDYDGDGKIESGAKEHAGAVHNAIQRKKGLPADGKDTSSVKEDFIGEVKTADDKKKKVTGEGVNNASIVKVFPDDKTAPSRHGMVVASSYEYNGAILSEKAVSTSQQKFMGMVLAAKRGGKAASPEVAKAAAGMSEKEAKKFAKTKHEGLPAHVKEASECGGDSDGDTRQMKTKRDKARTALGLMGIKASYEPEGEMVDEGRYGSIGGGDRNYSRRNRGLGGGTPEDEADAKRRGDAAAEAAKRRLRASLAREAQRKAGK